MVADQGPGFGLYNNIGNLRANYSIGVLDPTSDLGGALSFGYWSTQNTDHDASWKLPIGDEHRQLGNPEKLNPSLGNAGNEFRRETYLHFAQ